MINLQERMLPTSAGVEPATSWSPVGRRILLWNGMGKSIFMNHAKTEGGGGGGGGGMLIQYVVNCYTELPSARNL